MAKQPFMTFQGETLVTTKPPKQLQWRLAMMMAERGIRTATELHRRLTEYGIDISSDRISRIVVQPPERLNLELLAGLATVLDCGTQDLLRLLPPGPPQEPQESQEPPVATPAAVRKRERPPAAKEKTVSIAKVRSAAPKNDLDALVSSMLETKAEPIPLKKRD